MFPYVLPFTPPLISFPFTCNVSQAHRLAPTGVNERCVTPTFRNLRGCAGERYRFSRQTLPQDLKRSWRISVGTKNTRNERSGTSVCSLASAALEFRNKNWPHVALSAPVPVRNPKAEIMERYEHLTAFSWALMSPCICWLKIIMCKWLKSSIQR
jgi:hypothetical protein